MPMSPLDNLPNPMLVGPHKYESYGSVINRKICRACYLHRDDHHPGMGWTSARHYADKARRP